MMRRCVLWYLIAAMLIIGITPRLEAAFSPSDALVLSTAARSTDTATVQAALENRLVRQRLQDLGFSADEISAKLSQLSDQQLHSISQKLDDLRVGGDSGIGFVIGVLVIIALVLVIIHLSGHKVIVTR
jgi:hypothetical protein